MCQLANKECHFIIILLPTTECHLVALLMDEFVDNICRQVQDDIPLWHLIVHIHVWAKICIYTNSCNFSNSSFALKDKHALNGHACLFMFELYIKF